MTLVADSGSTKTAWCLTDGEHHELLMTQGINPFQQNEKNRETPAGGTASVAFCRADSDGRVLLWRWLYGREKPSGGFCHPTDITQRDKDIRG